MDKLKEINPRYISQDDFLRMTSLLGTFKDKKDIQSLRIANYVLRFRVANVDACDSELIHQVDNILNKSGLSKFDEHFLTVAQTKYDYLTKQQPMYDEIMSAR